MTETTMTPEGIPVITADPFSLKNLVDPHSLHEQMREAGPVVRLEAYGIWGMARYEQVNAALKDWQAFSSAAGAGLATSAKKSPGAYLACFWRLTRQHIRMRARSSVRFSLPQRSRHYDRLLNARPMS